MHAMEGLRTACQDPATARAVQTTLDAVGCGFVKKGTTCGVAVIFDPDTCVCQCSQVAAHNACGTSAKYAKWVLGAVKVEVKRAALEAALPEPEQSAPSAAQWYPFWLRAPASLTKSGS
jgi:hypothetical protein